MDLMFDLETLGTTPDCAVLTLGAVKFDPKTRRVESEGLLLKFNVDQQFEIGRTYSEDTLNWWNNQAPEIQEAAFGTDGRVDISDAVDQFHRFVWNSDRVWSQGSFDVNIMEHLFRQLEKPCPWNYWQVRDSRTLFDFVDGELDRSKHHDAFEDAVAQANGVCRALKKIGWHGQKL